MTTMKVMEKLTSSLPSKARTILAILFLSLALIIIFSIRSCNSERASYYNSQKNLQVLNHKNIILEAKVNALGDSLRIYEQVVYDRESIIGAKDKALDSLEKSLGIKRKEISSYLEFDVKSTQELTFPITLTQRDGSLSQKKEFIFEYADEWLNMAGTIMDDSLKVKYSLYDSYKIANIETKSTLFKPQEFRINITSENPHTEISGLTSFVVKDPKPKRKTRAIIGSFLVGTTVGIISGIYLSK